MDEIRDTYDRLDGGPGPTVGDVAGALERRRRRRVTAGAATVCVLAGLAVVGALIASTPGTPRPIPAAVEGHPGELTDAGGEPCPRELPVAEDPGGHGFGVDRPADGAPRLLDTQRAWVCEYTAYEIDRTETGGIVLGWRRNGQPVAVADSDLAALRVALTALGPTPAEHACTADLGPRWMVVLEHAGDLTGVVVDDYGCRDARITEDPHHTPPGASGQDDESLSGVHSGGMAVLDAIGLGRGR